MNARVLWGNPFARHDGDAVSDIAFLGRVPIFDTLSRRQKNSLHSLIHIRRFSPGEIVFRQDDPGVGLYIVREGAVSVWHESADLTKTKMIDLHAGDFFGEISLLNDSPRSATVVAEGDTTLFGFFRSDLLSLMDSDPKLGVKLVYQLARIVAERLTQSNQSTPD